jgi:ADP-ribose pyrophosphatase YjhB (NUDIX family)
VGAVEHVHVAVRAGAPVRAVGFAEATAGVGLAGDRYARAGGFWRDERVSRDVTLVEAEVVEELGLAPGETRRNLTTRGVRLDELVGHTFWVGDVLCRGTGLCEPCRHLEDVTGKQLLRGLVHRGGLRADILTGGVIRVGDPVERVEEQQGVGVLVVRGGKVLLGRRLAAHGYGTWSFPGGKPLAGESPSACALRELREETSLEGGAARVVAESLDGFPESRAVFRTRFVAVENAVGEPRVLEPEKAAAWSWHGWHELPTPLFRPAASFVEQMPAPERISVDAAPRLELRDP